MAEDTAGQERKPIMSKLFPVREKSALAAFSNLSLTENPDGAQEEANNELDILSKTNPHVLDYDEGILLQIPREAADQLFGGILVSHRALREEAEAQGGILPTFTDEFIEEFHNKGVEALQTMSDDNQISLLQAARELSRQHLIEFRNMEPEFSKTVESKLGVKPDWDPEEDLGYAGIINTYLLFRKGCKDPKNFQQ